MEIQMRNWIVVCYGHVYGTFDSPSATRQWIAQNYGARLLTNPDNFWITRLQRPARGIHDGQEETTTEGDAEEQGT